MNASTQNTINGLTVGELLALRNAIGKPDSNIKYKVVGANNVGFEVINIYLPYFIISFEVKELPEVITLVNNRLEDEDIREEIREVLNG